MIKTKFHPDDRTFHFNRNHNHNNDAVEEAKILRYISDGHNIAQTAQKFDIDCMIVKRIVGELARLEKVPKKPKQRNNIKLKEKIQVLHFIESGYSVPKASKKFDILYIHEL